jgi:hypothetical protein
MGRRPTGSLLCLLTVCVTTAQAKLIHHWQFEEDPGVTTVAADSVGGLDGTIQGPVSAAGQVGQALSFDGADDRVDVQGFVAPLQGTVALWINPSLAKSKERFLGAGGDFEIWLRSNGELKNELFDSGSTTLGTGAGAVKANEWQHVAETYDSATTAVAIYLNGEQKAAGSANVPSVPTGTVLLFGWRPGAAAAEHYTGLLDDIQIYDEVLAADQIQGLYQNPGSTIGTATTTASGPSPAVGAIAVPASAVLTWTPGIHTDGLSPKHRLLFSADFNELNNALAGVLQDSQRYPAEGTLELDLGETYYWRVDEANSVTGWDVGDLWYFTVADYLRVDDFEDYNNVEPSRVFDTWLDGWDVVANGSVVGYSVSPFAEQTLVHGGKQSMPVRYHDAGPAYYSEVTVYLEDLGCPRDWTTQGVEVLSLWFRGRPAGDGASGNQAEPMYVAVSNKNGTTGVVYHPDPQATLLDTWTEWQIDLKQFSDQGVNLTDVYLLMIGFGNRNKPQAGGAGMMYFDDLRLYPPNLP